MLAHAPAPLTISCFVICLYTFWTVIWKSFSHSGHSWVASSSCDQNLLFETYCSLNIVAMTRDKNSERWITRLVCRWRAQPAVWINVNCRTLWTSTSWTHIAATISVVATPVRGSASYLSSHPLSDGIQCLTLIIYLMEIHCNVKCCSPVKHCFVCWTGREALPRTRLDELRWVNVLSSGSSSHHTYIVFFFHFLTSDQTWLPAELKHISKRRKRN